MRIQICLSLNHSSLYKSKFYSKNKCRCEQWIHFQTLRFQIIELLYIRLMKTPTIELYEKFYGVRVYKGFNKLRLADRLKGDPQKDLKWFKNESSKF